ncbi:hypothetical protein ACHAW5_004088 [Stephanodiscus triporus]|uniref:Nudix hydrolase domain-containing protein n=1 Tax=Stephanodiscus triporus TaxID=2934178 RepID=A0ABD3PWC8_9STRA
MSDPKIKSFLPLPPVPFSNDESKKSVLVNDMVSIYDSRVPQSTISPVPTHNTMYGPEGRRGRRAERLTPTGQGRIKSPPICMAQDLKRVASSIFDFSVSGVCFSPKEVELCAEKSFVLDKYLELSSQRSAETMAGTATASDGNNSQEVLSSSSSIVSTSSCGRSATRDETTAVASLAVKNDPPLEVVSANSAVVLESDALSGSGGDVSVAVEQVRFASGHCASTETAKVSENSRALLSPRTASLTTFASKLIKVSSSRQGRSLQRWLVHSPTTKLMRQTAGTIPITRDGRIVLISASRKKEWILPKGGWDADETKEECAMRETYEEGGIVGLLGGCLEPIDYERAKSKKGILKELGVSDVEAKAGGEVEGRMSNCHEGLCPPLPKRVKTELSSLPTDPELILSSVKRKVSSDSNWSTSADGFNGMTGMTPTVAPNESFEDYSYVRLFLFPLYVSSVKSEWPEKGRLRKLVHIDEAIRIMDAQSRPYFRMGLELVKKRGLHLLMKSEQPDE